MSPRPVLPISLHLDDRDVLLVGDGEAADERAGRLAAAGSTPRRVRPAAYTADLCEGAFLVLAMSGDRSLDERIAGDARARGALAYAHDQPRLSDLAMPAVARRGPLVVAVATAGHAPALAARLREELERLFETAGPRLDRLLADLAHARTHLPHLGRRDALRAMARRLRIAGRFVIDDG